MAPYDLRPLKHRRDDTTVEQSKKRKEPTDDSDDADETLRAAKRQHGENATSNNGLVTDDDDKSMEQLAEVPLDQYNYKSWREKTMKIVHNLKKKLAERRKERDQEKLDDYKLRRENTMKIVHNLKKKFANRRKEREQEMSANNVIKADSDEQEDVKVPPPQLSFPLKAANQNTGDVEVPPLQPSFPLKAANQNTGEYLNQASLTTTLTLTITANDYKLLKKTINLLSTTDEEKKTTFKETAGWSNGWRRGNLCTTAR